MELLNWIKLLALNDAVKNMSEVKIADMIIDFQKKEFGKESDKAIGLVSDKLMRIALELNKRK